MSLATRYRPKTLDDVIGQDNVISTLKTQLDKGTLPQAMMFTGLTGVGKSTISKIIANNINAYVYELDVASHNSIDDIKTVCEMIKTKPLGFDNVVIVLDEVHRANNVNTLQPLLITLETLPKYAYIIMCTTNPEKLLPTIRNRCVEYKLSGVESDVIANRLEYICDNERISYDKEALIAIAEFSGGSVRQAISNLERISNNKVTLATVNNELIKASYSTMMNLLYAYLDNDTERVIELINSIDYIDSFVQRFFTFLLDVKIIEKTKNINLTTIPTLVYNNIIEFNSTEFELITKLTEAMFKLQFEGKNSIILRELLIASIILT